MLRVMLAGCELELAPAEVAGHPAIRQHAQSVGKRPGQVLLDQNLHGPALGRLEDGKRRGRPDIVQYTLLVLLESPLAKTGGLEVALHTRHHDLVRIKPGTRLPRGESRFAGLMAKVLAEGRSQDQDPLVWSEGRMPPAEALGLFTHGPAAAPVVRLDETGPLRDPRDLPALAKGGDLTIVLGAFPAGDFDPAWKKAVPDAVSIWKEPLTAWSVAAEVAAAFRAGAA